MSEFEPGPGETNGETQQEPSPDSQPGGGPEDLDKTEHEDLQIVETAEMLGLRQQAIQAKGERAWLNLDVFRDQFLEPYLQLAQDQLPQESTAEQQQLGELELHALKALFYEDVGLGNNANAFITRMGYGYDKIGRPELTETLRSRIEELRASRDSAEQQPEALEPGTVEEFLEGITIYPLEPSGEAINCSYQAEDNEVFKRLIQVYLLPRLSGDGTVLVRGDTLTPDQLTILGEEMLRADYPVVGAYDAETGHYRVVHSDGSEEVGQVLPYQ